MQKQVSKLIVEKWDELTQETPPVSHQQKRLAATILYLANRMNCPMSIRPNQSNTLLLKDAINSLTQTINIIGEKAASSPLTGNILLKHALIDLLKKVNANLYGISLMLPQLSEPNKQLLKIPIGLCMRGALSDCLTGMYLFTFSDDPASTEKEVDVFDFSFTIS